MDDGEPSGKAVTTDESAINGCLENLQGKQLKYNFSLLASYYISFDVSSENLMVNQNVSNHSGQSQQAKKRNQS